MSTGSTVTINGVEYDSATGLRVSRSARTDGLVSRSSTEIPRSAPTKLHVKTKKSVTLKREYVKKPVSARPI
ncbi:hypothetical protein B7Z28_01750, partial [Candidatus Saccharibacteria bacterium 32-45-3]